VAAAVEAEATEVLGVHNSQASAVALFLGHAINNS
jgi:hypothetical protein